MNLYTWDLELGTETWRLEPNYWDLGLGTWDLGLGTWDLGLGTWDLGLGTWDLGLGTWDLGLGTWCLSLLSYPPHYQDFLYLKRVKFRLSCHPEQSGGSHYCPSVSGIISIIALQVFYKH